MRNIKDVVKQHHLIIFGIVYPFLDSLGYFFTEDGKFSFVIKYLVRTYKIGMEVQVPILTVIISAILAFVVCYFIDRFKTVSLSRTQKKIVKYIQGAGTAYLVDVKEISKEVKLSLEDARREMTILKNKGFLTQEDETDNDRVDYAYSANDNLYMVKIGS